MSWQLRRWRQRQPDPTRVLPRRTQLGFTLVEVLVVLVVLALAAGVAVANFNTLHQRARLESETRELASFLRSVPDRARELHGPAFLRWEAASRRLEITADAAGGQLVDRHLVSDQVVVATALPAVLRCDTISRAYVGQSPIMMSTIQTIDLVHAHDQANRIRYRLVLSPLWSVVVERRAE